MITIGKLIHTSNPKLLPPFRGQKLDFITVAEEDIKSFLPRRKRRNKKLVTV